MYLYVCRQHCCLWILHHRRYPVEVPSLITKPGKDRWSWIQNTKSLWRALQPCWPSYIIVNSTERWQCFCPVIIRSRPFSHLSPQICINYLHLPPRTLYQYLVSIPRPWTELMWCFIYMFPNCKISPLWLSNKVMDWQITCPTHFDFNVFLKSDSSK